MTTYYVGAGGNNSNAGTSWAQRKLTLNGAEDIPVAAGDTVYVGAGTYAEQLTCDVSGSSGSPITYIGDYDGSHTDGTGGVVVITGGIKAVFISKNFRSFKYINFRNSVYSADSQPADLTVENCVFSCNNGANAIYAGNYYFTNLTVRNCIFFGSRNGTIVSSGANSLANETNNLIENCLFFGGVAYTGAINTKQGGTTVRNCTFIGGYVGVEADVNTGQTVTVNNCLFQGVRYALKAGAAGELTEDYNNIYDCEVARTNVSVGANSTAIDTIFDVRWAFELLNGGSMLSPFDLSSASTIINVAGTTPTTADMRGTTVQGTNREWGALEYDSTLDIEAGTGGGGAVSIQPIYGRISL